MKTTLFLLLLIVSIFGTIYGLLTLGNFEFAEIKHFSLFVLLTNVCIGAAILFGYGFIHNLRKGN